MTPAITLPPLPTRDVIQHTGASAGELAELQGQLTRNEAHLNALEEQYTGLCRIADEQGDVVAVDDLVRSIWDYLCEWMILDQQQLAKYRQWTRSAYNDAFIAGVSRHAERLAELMRTIDVVWEELELETPDEIAEVVWTIRISPLAYLRAMWNLFWSSIRHPFSDATIELKTGRILRTE